MKQPDQGQVAELARDAHHDVVQGAGGGTLVARTEELSDLSCQFLLEMLNYSSKAFQICHSPDLIKFLFLVM